MKNIILSNINLNSIIRKLPEEYFCEVGYGYNNWIQFLLKEVPEHYSEFSNIFIILDGCELYKEYDAENVITLMQSLHNLFVNNESINFHISDLHMYQNSLDDTVFYNMEEYKAVYLKQLRSIIMQSNNVFVIKLSQVISDYGANNFYSIKMWYMASNKYSPLGEKYIISEIIKIINSRKRVNKKCIIIDMDNTLWGGVIGEVGYENIELSSYGYGARFKDFQYRLKEIKEKGVLLAIVSKNNLDDALSCFQNPEMVLKKDDFIFISANWKDKSHNIREIALQLNIGLDSMVFIDDNPIEREQVKINLPMVTVIDFPDDTSQLSKLAIDIYNQYFFKTDLSFEDINKTLMYHENLERLKVKETIDNLDEFIKNLKIILKVRTAKLTDLKRISELSLKTNQYNTSGIRYSESDLIKLMSDKEYDILLGEVEDRIGNSGISIVAILKYNNDNAYLENLFMSCRIMNRNIEKAFLKLIIDRLRKKSLLELYGDYISSGKNTPALDFFTTNGDFVELNKTNNYRKFRLCINGYEIKQCLVEGIWFEG